MRALNFEEQEQRKKKVLQFVIHEFVRTGKPVGSGAISAMGRLGLSSATIRNVLAELEKEEMITHPHTSAGRVPTDKGYRHYVDSLIELQRLAGQEESRIRSEYESRIREIEDLMSQTSCLLSSLSHYTGFVMTPKLERNRLSSLELIPIGERRILVAMITESGLAKHFIINAEGEFSRERLRTVSRMISKSFKGSTLQEVQSKLDEGMEDSEREFRDIHALAGRITQEIKKYSSSEIYMDGASNILALPDFSKVDELQSLFRIIEEKQFLSNIFEKEIQDLMAQPKPATPRKASRVHVRIGSENPLKAMQNLSLVSSTYQFADRTVGVLGILGPKRMEYPKMIALVDYISQMMNRFIGKRMNP